MNPILISGVPACGKTSFGDYLRDNHGFVHIDLEARPERQHVLHTLWSRAYPNGLGSYFSELKKIHPKVVMTWGFPYGCLPLIPNIQQMGVDCWWFDGDMDKAEAEWIKREGHPPSGVARQQFDNLRVHAGEFPAIYGNKFVRTLDKSGYVKSYAELHALVSS